MVYSLFDLQLFAEGDGGAMSAPVSSDAGSAPDTAAGSQTAETQPATAPMGKCKANPLANVRYGIQPEAEQPAPIEEQAPQQETQRASFDDLIAGEYKDDYQAKIQATIQERLKGSKQREEKMTPLLQALSEQYGKDASDIDGIVEAFTNDPSRYEKEALEQGITPEYAARLAKLKRMEDASKAAEEAARQEQMLQAHYHSLEQQAEAMKELYPGFDLQRELQNEKFYKWTLPEGGMSVEEAYMALHGREIAAAGMKYAVERSAQKVASSVASNARRPAEGGMQRAAAVEVKSDPRQFTKADKEEIRRRVRMGEKIVL